MEEVAAEGESDAAKDAVGEAGLEVLVGGDGAYAKVKGYHGVSGVCR